MKLTVKDMAEFEMLQDQDCIDVLNQLYDQDFRYYFFDIIDKKAYGSYDLFNKSMVWELHSNEIQNLTLDDYFWAMEGGELEGLYTCKHFTQRNQ